MTPESASCFASFTMSAMGRERCRPRSLGMMQNAHLLSQPSEIFRYAVYPGIEFTFGTEAV